MASRAAAWMSRAEREFGFRAATPFDGGLRKTIQWFQSNRAEIGEKGVLGGSVGTGAASIRSASIENRAPGTP